MVAENLLITGGQVNAHDQAGAGGSIDDLVRVRTGARGVTMMGFSLKGSSRAAEYTARGLFVDGPGEVFWFGGVIQGGFLTSAVDVVGPGNTICIMHSGHIEVIGGESSGIGYRYDNANGTMTLVGPSGGDVEVGPVANAFGFTVQGGSLGAITLGAFAKSPKLFMDKVGSAIVDSGAEFPVIGTHRIEGSSVANPGPPVVMTTSTRPAATATLVGAEIFNTDTNTPNFSDGTNWRPAGLGAKEESGAVTLDWEDGVLNVDTAGGAVVVTLPDVAAFDGKAYLIRRDGANIVTINRAGADTFDTGATSIVLGQDGDVLDIISIGDGEWKII